MLRALRILGQDVAEATAAHEALDVDAGCRDRLRCSCHRSRPVVQLDGQILCHVLSLLTSGGAPS